MDKNEAIEILRKGCPDINRYAASELDAYEYDVETYNEAVGYAISHLEEDRWIPVSERLPDFNGKYLAITNYGTMIVHFSRDKDRPYSIQFDTLAKVYYWRPLPKAPESEADDD